MWQNKRGTDWWQQAIGLCTVPYPAVCRDGDNPPVDIGLYDREANYVVKIGDAPEELRPTEPGGGPGAYIFIERHLELDPAYDFALIYNLGASVKLDSPFPGGPKTAEADFSTTATIYVDSDIPGYLVADDGHDYSDPARRKAQIIVKSSAPPSPDQRSDLGYKIVGGGAQLAAGSDHFLIASHPISASSGSVAQWLVAASGAPTSTDCSYWL